nr:unnamed protein product [Digitaria exilis]
MNGKITTTIALCLLLMTCGAEAFLCNRAKPADTAKGFRYLNTACALLSAMMAVAVVVAAAVVEHNQGSQCLHSQ